MSTDHPLTSSGGAGRMSPFMQEYAASRLKWSLPITSVCENCCIFCSNRFNPFTLPKPEHRRLADIRMQLEAVVPHNGWLELGLTSPGRLAEGDPITHPQFFEILDMIRRFFHRYDVVVGVMFPTVGTKLTEDFIRRLAALEMPVKLETLSVNSSNLENWSRIVRRPKNVAEIAIQAPRLLKQHGVPFNASLVALPNFVGWHDIHDTIQHCIECGAGEVVVWEPGVSRMVDERTREILDCDPRELRERVRQWQRQEGWPVPVLVYPLPVEEAHRATMRRVIELQHKPTVLLPSTAAAEALVEEVAAANASHVTVWPVPNRTYGGNIRVSGLLCVSDFRAAIGDYLREPSHRVPQRVVLPTSSFDVFGRDLVYESYTSIENALKDECELDVELCLEHDFL